MATIILSSTLTQFTENNGKFAITGKTLFGVLLNTIQKYPHLRPYLFDVKGDLTPAMKFYLNEENISTKRWHNLPITNSDVLSILFVGQPQFTKDIDDNIEISYDAPMRNEKRDRVKLAPNH